MLAKFEECVAFTLIEPLKIEHVLVERHRLLHVIHFHGDVIASVNLHIYKRSFVQLANFRFGRFRFLASTDSHLAPEPIFRSASCVELPSCDPIARWAWRSAA